MAAQEGGGVSDNTQARRDSLAVRFSVHRPMRSASAHAEARKYRMLAGKSGKRWLVAVQSAEADNVYVEGGRNSQGFAGRTISFELESGEVVALSGPWKVSAEELLKDTAYDATDKYTSLGIIALEREKDWKNGDLYQGILHKDDQSIIGRLNRIDTLAQGFADKLGRKIYFGVITYGGGTAGSRSPKPRPSHER